jgi:putative membrane protein
MKTNTLIISAVLASVIIPLSSNGQTEGNTTDTNGLGATTSTVDTNGLAANTNGTTGMDTNGVAGLTDTNGPAGTNIFDGLSGTGFSNADARWLVQAAGDSLHEVNVGNLAQTNSSNTNVQAFGAVLVQDHTLANLQAAQLAALHGVTLPTTEPRPLQRETARLARLNGAAFDAAFVTAMIRGHVKDIQSFMTEAQRGRSEDVRAFARAQLPVLTEHLVIALELREMLSLPATLASSNGNNSNNNNSNHSNNNNSNSNNNSTSNTNSNLNPNSNPNSNGTRINSSGNSNTSP